MAHLAAEAARCGEGDSAARRGVACVRVALADLLNLARTGRLLLSAWSSWEEALSISPLYLPYTSPISPLYLLYISPISPLYLSDVVLVGGGPHPHGRT